MYDGDQRSTYSHLKKVAEECNSKNTLADIIAACCVILIFFVPGIILIASGIINLINGRSEDWVLVLLGFAPILFGCLLLFLLRRRKTN